MRHQISWCNHKREYKFNYDIKVQFNFHFGGNDNRMHPIWLKMKSRLEIRPQIDETGRFLRGDCKN